MTAFSPRDLDALLCEHRALLGAYGAAQARCSRLLQEQATQIAALNTQLMRLRASAIVRETARALALEDTGLRRDAVPAVLCVGTHGAHAAVAQRVVEMVGGHFLHHDGRDDGGSDGYDAAALEASLVAADLVICQTGCLSHGAYWRVQDHCRRTGKQCVLVAQPDALEKVVRLHRSPALSQHTEDTEATHS